MRTILVSAFSALALAACSGAAPDTRTDAVVAADRYFAADAGRIGWIDAYPVWAAKEGFVLQGGGLESALTFAENIHPDVRGDTSLAWGPDFAGVSAAGDFGFTSGVFNGDGTAFGHYLTVWRKQADGNWRWLFEGGIDVTTPTVVPGPDAAVTAIAPSVPTGTLEEAQASVLAAEAALGAKLAADGPMALAGFLAADARVQREMHGAATGIEGARAMIAKDPAGIAYGAPINLEMSAAGDMAFTVGDVQWTDGGGHTTRIWAHTKDGWRIVFDQIIPL